MRGHTPIDFSERGLDVVHWRCAHEHESIGMLRHGFGQPIVHLCGHMDPVGPVRMGPWKI